MIKYATKSMLILALVASLFSFAKFEHCRVSGWGTPDVYVHACYSDLSALFGARGLDHHAWPYSDLTDSVEYPPGTAMVMWATSWLVPHSPKGFTDYFDINAFLIALLFLGTALLISRMNPEFWYLLPLSPAVLASLYINWDMWAVISAIAAIYFFDKEKYFWSAALLGLSIATKFFPVVLLIPVALIFYRRKAIANLINYIFISGFTWLLLNLPFIVTTPHGWWRFFKLNSERGADFGSLLYGLELFGIKISSVNNFALLLFVIMTAILIYIFFLLKKVPTLAASSFLYVVAFTSASKVYSPQYVLWLTPVAILAISSLGERARELRKDFWIWQAGELIYHLAVWEYLASYTGAHFGLPTKAYAAAIFLRLGTTFWLVARLISRSSTREIDPQELEFLSTATDGYA